jgi:hypothetical protein
MTIAPVTPRSLQQIIERGVFPVHFRAPDRIYYDRRRIDGARTPSRCGQKPVVMIGRHQNQFVPALPGDLERLSPGAVLELAKFALKFGESNPCHRIASRFCAKRIV